MKKLPKLEKGYYIRCPVCNKIGCNLNLKKHYILEHHDLSDAEIKRIEIEREFDFLK